MSFLHHFSFSRNKPFAKNLVNGIFWIFVFFGVYLLLLASETFWVYPRFQGVIAFVSAFFIILPLVFYQRTRLKEWYHEHFLYASEMLIAIPLSLNGLGAVIFFDAGWGFDSFIHFFNSLAAALLIFLIVGAFLTVNTLGTRIILYFLSIAGAFTSGVLMEGWEWVSDTYFGTHTWGEIGQAPWYDTSVDLFYNALGVGIGAFLLFFWGSAWLLRLRRVTPTIRTFVHGVKERVQENMGERVERGMITLRTTKRVLTRKGRKIKKRMGERSRQLLARRNQFRARLKLNPVRNSISNGVKSAVG